MRIDRVRKRLLVGFAAAGLCLAFTTGCEQEKVEVDPMAGYRVATVDILPLVELHPNYSKLEQLSESLEKLKEEKELIQRESQEKIVSGGKDEMEKAMEAARAKLEAERAQVEGEIAALSSSLSAQMEGEMNALKASYEAELKAEIEKLAPSAAAPPTEEPPLDVNVEGQVQDYLSNLSLVRERNLAAKRLELEKRVGDEIAAKKAEVDGQIATFEADLAAQYQGERLNLQLTAQNSTDEEAKTAAEDRLAAITQEIDAAKQAKRAELEGGYAAVRAEKTAQVQGELEAYQKKLDAEVQAKLAQKRQELGGAIPVPRPAAPSGPPPAVAAKIREIEGRMKAQLASKQAALKSQLEAKIAKAEPRLKKKQEEVEANLRKLEEEITIRITDSMANMPKEVKDKVEEIDGKIAQLEDERKKLYESIRGEVNTEIGGVAQKKEQEMVLGLTMDRSCFYKDESFVDLTDLSQVRIQQMESK